MIVAKRIKLEEHLKENSKQDCRAARAVHQQQTLVRVINHHLRPGSTQRCPIRQCVSIIRRSTHQLCKLADKSVGQARKITEFTASLRLDSSAL